MKTKVLSALFLAFALFQNSAFAEVPLQVSDVIVNPIRLTCQLNTIAQGRQHMCSTTVKLANPALAILGSRLVSQNGSDVSADSALAADGSTIRLQFFIYNMPTASESDLQRVVQAASLHLIVARAP